MDIFIATETTRATENTGPVTLPLGAYTTRERAFDACRFSADVARATQKFNPTVSMPGAEGIEYAIYQHVVDAEAGDDFDIIFDGVSGVDLLRQESLEDAIALYECRVFGHALEKGDQP